MNSKTSVKSVCNWIRKLKGKESSNTIHHLSVNDNLSYNSSSDFSTTAFASVRMKAKKQNINVSSDNAELHKMPFSME